LERLSNVTTQCEEMEAWLTEMIKAQDKLKDHEDPVLTSEEISAKLKLITKDVKKLQKIPKPRAVKEKEAKEAALEFEKAEAAKKAAEAEAEAKADESDAKEDDKGEKPEIHDELRR